MVDYEKFRIGKFSFKNTIGEDMKNLGTMNGWKVQPQEYKNHLENCGHESAPFRYCLGKPGEYEMRTQRVYQVAKKKLGNCYHQETCQECGCTWAVDSGG